MYYLQSRYYDAKICRFINADGYVSTGQGVIGNNMFSYCNNNPVMGYDPTGEYCVANKDSTDTNYLDDWLIEGAGAGGYGGTGNYFGYGTSYYSYSIRSYSSATNNPRYYNVTGAVSVNDGMATTRLPSNASYNLNGSKSEMYISKRGWDTLKIDDAIKNGVQGISINMANGAQCTVYRYPGTINQYIVVENISRNIVQASNLNDAGWIPDPRIIWTNNGG